MESKFSEQLDIRWLAVTFVVLMALSFFVDIEALRGWVERAGIFAPLVFILLKILTIVIAPLSGAPLYPLVGLLFGFGPGFAYVLIGDFLGFSAAFFLSRCFGRPVVLHFISKNEAGLLSKIIERAGTGKGFFHPCISFIGMPELVSYGAGLSQISYRKFIVILMPFYVVISAILVFLGSLLDPSQQTFFVKVFVPVAGIVLAFVGGFLFVRDAKNNISP